MNPINFESLPARIGKASLRNARIDRRTAHRRISLGMFVCLMALAAGLLLSLK